MEYIQQLIGKFWKGEASEQERKDLHHYLQHHREELEEFLKKADNDWPVDLNLSDEATALRSLKEIHRKAGIASLDLGSPMRRYWSVMRFAAAAILLVALGVAISRWLPLGGTDNPDKNMTRSGAEPIMRTNTGATEMMLTLPDRTLVHLAPQGSILYTPHFGIKQRNISLKGKARFEVTEDATKPFTVYANGYATTALGTEFIVSTHSDKTSIKLLSGKVVVRATSKSRFPITDSYLTPGDELQINMLDGHLDLHPGKPEDNGAGESAEISAAQRNGPKAPIFLHFDETPLATVFAQIENALNIDIICVDTDLTNLSFTGRLSLISNKTDSLNAVFALLCQKNGLAYRYQNNQIVISKKQ